jgi:hypothetical protein
VTLCVQSPSSQLPTSQLYPATQTSHGHLSNYLAAKDSQIKLIKLRTDVQHTYYIMAVKQSLTLYKMQLLEQSSIDRFFEVKNSETSQIHLRKKIHIRNLREKP